MRHKIGLLLLATAHFLKHHATKTYMRVKYLASRASRFIPQETAAAPNRIGGYVGPQSRSGRFGQEGIRNPDCPAHSLITILSYPGSILTP